MIGGWNPLTVSLGIRIFILNSIGGKIILDSHWFLKDERDKFSQLTLDKENKFKEGSGKAWQQEFVEVFFCVIFLGEERRRMMSLSRWWKEEEWAKCLGYFKGIEVSRIVLKN